MIKEGHFGFYEAFSLMTIALITKIFYASPMVIIKSLGTAAWYGTLISCATTLVIFYVIYLLMKRFPQQDLFQIFETVTGKVVGKCLIFIFSAYLLYKAGVNIREFVAILKVYSMPFTPPSVLILAFLLVVVAMAYVGLEGMARLAYVFFYPVVGSLFILLILAIPSYDFNYLQPVLGYGLRKTIEVGVTRSGAYDEIIILAIIIRSIHGVQTFRRVGVATLIMTGFIFSISLVCLLAAFQYTVAGEHLSGMYQLTRVIYYSRFFQRIEAIFLFIWVISSVITVGLLFYIALSSYCRVFNINNHRPLMIPFSILTFIIAFHPDHLSEVIEVHVKIVRVYSTAIWFLIPLLVFGIAIIRGKKGGKNGAKAKA